MAIMAKNKSHTETTVHWAYYTVTQFIQPRSFNLLVRSGKRLLNGWSHKIQMKSLKTKQLTEFTHFLLETGMGWTVRWDWEEFQNWPQVHVLGAGEDGDEIMRWSGKDYSNSWPNSRTFWRRMGWNSQIRGIQAIEQVHVRPWGGWRGEDGIGWLDKEYSNIWSSPLTVWRRMKRMG